MSSTQLVSPQPIEKLLTVEDVAEAFQVSRSWVYAAASAGRLPAVRLGSALRFRQADLEKWLAKSVEGPPARAVVRGF
jgi:excisionase family DNA binding protein